MDNREANNILHPPTCTCRECVQARLGRVIKRQPYKFSEEKICPFCKQRSLVLNPRTNKYECINPNCRGNLDEFNQEVADEKEAPTMPSEDKISAPPMMNLQTDRKETVVLQVCPSCKQKSLMLNAINKRYECVNPNCRDSYHQVTIDKFNQNVAADKETLEAASKKETTAWFGNQYYDAKKKKWRDAKYRRVPIGSSYTWIWSIVLFLLVSLIVTIILSYFKPGSTFFIIGW